MVFMWTDKHAPRSLIEMVGNPDHMTEIRLWASSWKQGTPQKPLLLVGSPGTGKTLAAYVAAKEFGFSLVEFNASDTRNKETIEKVVSAAALNASFSGDLRLVLLDEVDGLQGSKDKGGLPAMLSVLKSARNPVILTANDVYSDSRIAGIRSFCKMLSFKKIPSPSIAKRLREICEKENIDYDALSLNELAKNSSGDLRAAVLDLESIVRSSRKITLEDVQNSGYRERQDNVFNTIRTIFVSSSFNEIRRARASVEVDHSLFKKWVEENIPRQFPMTRSLAPALDTLSRADVFDGRIFRRQHYGFLKYSGDLSASVGLVAPERAHGFISYQFPSILKRLSLMKGSSKRSVVEKIQEHVFGSRPRITQELVFYSALLSNDALAPSLISLFEFEDADVAFLLQTTPTSAKVKRLMEAAAALKEKPPSRPVEIPLEMQPVKKSRKAAVPAAEVAPTPEESKNQTSLSRFFG